MRFVQPAVVLLGIPMYLGLVLVPSLMNPDGASSTLEQGASVWVLTIIGVWNLLLLAATIVALVDSIRSIRAGKTRQLATSAMVVKLAAIPFFVTNFAVLTVAFNVSILVIWIGPVLWLIVLVGSFLTYATMLGTSVYTWAAIARLRRERIIGSGLTVLYALMCCFFLTDIVAGVLVFGHSRRRPRLAAVWLSIGTGIAFIVLGVADYLVPFLYYVLILVAAFTNASLDPSSNSYWAEWATPIALGVLVIVVTGAIALIRRTSLRSEAERARAAAAIPSESYSDEAAPALAG
jgi:hypothetical protein